MNTEEKIEKIREACSEAGNLEDFLRYKEAYLKNIKTMRFILDEYEPDLKFFRIAVGSNISTDLYAMHRYKEAYELGADILREAEEEYGKDDELVWRIKDNIMRILLELRGHEVEAMEMANLLYLEISNKARRGPEDERAKKTKKFLDRCRAAVEKDESVEEKKPIREIIGFRCCTDSAYRYDFYMNREFICTVSCGISTRPGVYISNFEYKLLSPFMEVRHKCDGMVRHVKTVESEEYAYSLIYFHDFDFYTMSGNFNKDILVENYGDTINYSQDDKLIGQINRIDTSDWIPTNEWVPKNGIYKYTPYYSFLLYEQHAKTLEILSMLSFPMLRFV